MNIFFRARRQTRSQLWVFSVSYRARFLSSVPSTPTREELREERRHQFEVECCSSGSVRVDVFNQKALKNPSAPLVIYLPPTGVHLSKYHPLIPSYLFSTTAALAQINYRWNVPLAQGLSSTASSQAKKRHYYPFPFPIHDVLQVYTHITDKYLPSLTPQNSTRDPYDFSTITPDAPVPRPVLIYGEFLGGTLATSLALSEYSADDRKSVDILGLIAKQGIYNWLDIKVKDSMPPKNSSAQDFCGDNIDSATELRRRLFSTPSGCYDAFASPIFFFRTPGLSVSQYWTDQDGVDLISKYNHLIGTGETSTSDSESDSKTNDEDDSARQTGKPFKLEGYKFGRLKVPQKPSGHSFPRTLFLYSNQTSDSVDYKCMKSLIGFQDSIPEIDMISQTENIARQMILSASSDKGRGESKEDALFAAQDRVELAELGGGFHEEQALSREWIEKCLFQ